MSGRSFIQLSGQRFGKLTVLAFAGSAPNRKSLLWNCRCDCGSEAIIRTGNLTGGGTKSCGCHRREHARAVNLRHGHNPKVGRESREHTSWRSMKRRCGDATSDNYKYYGARGITVCDRWAASFAAFLEDMGPRPPGTTLDRKDGDLNYEPGNCHWATYSEQRRNQRHRRRATRPGADQPPA